MANPENVCAEVLLKIEPQEFVKSECPKACKRSRINNRCAKPKKAKTASSFTRSRGCSFGLERLVHMVSCPRNTRATHMQPVTQLELKAVCEDMLHQAKDKSMHPSEATGSGPEKHRKDATISRRRQKRSK